MSKETEQVRCLIIGSGPAGFTAAIYAARANLKPVVYAGLQPGGQLTTTTDIENFPGYPEGVNGSQMMDDLQRQAERFGAEVRYGVIESVELGARPYTATADDGTCVEAETIIIATGASAKYLGLPNEDRLKGAGVSACATCDGFFYRGKTVAVVGGGDTACEEAGYLAGLCQKVYLIVRRDVLRASKAMQEKIQNTPNIEVLWKTQTLDVLGDDRVTGVKLTTPQGERSLPLDGFFLAIGHHPNSEVFSHWLKTDEQGYILTQPGSAKTDLEGVFACGDVQDPRYRQAITAAASGCQAALDAERWLMTRR
jgi:thioredoxin reductase (NADPH)